MSFNLSQQEKEFDFANGEILLVDKPLTWTSFDVVNKIRYSIKPMKVKVGHGGTLDPLATGLLIICTGKFTKKLEHFQAEEKEYTGTFTLGATRPTYDMESEIDQSFPYDHISAEDIIQTAQTFIGESEQTPPLHSAVKVEGERVYEKARRGEKVTLKKRKIHIFAFEITKIDLPEVSFRISCSKGTYIRSIAHDFGKALKTGAYLSSLKRVKSGNFALEDAWDLQDLIKAIKEYKNRSTSTVID